MAYEDYCAACTYMGDSCDYNGQYYCSKKGNVYANDPRCYSFTEAYSRSSSARENMYDNSASHQTSGCYLTTIMCNILNFEDDNTYLQTLRNFRNNTMQKNVNYFPLLLQYDIIGPIISENLSLDENKYQIAESLFNNYIKASVDAIQQNEEQKAINIYIAMTKVLAEKYHVNTNVEISNLSSINPQSLGHGKVKQLLIKNI